MSNDPNQPISWLRRTLQRLTGGQQRDVIAAHVEQGARGVVVGKNIVQIGTLVVPLWPLVSLLVIVLLLVVGAGVWALNQRGPAQMQGQFNLALAQFAELDAQGKPHVSERSRSLGSLVYRTLANERAIFLQSNPGSPVDVWHDGSVPWNEQGAEVGLVTNEQEAARVAQRLAADVLIYGTLDQEARFTLQFYVSPRRRIYGGPNVIAGRYRFSDPIQLDANDLLARSDELTVRSGALFWLITGLQADSVGRGESAIGRFSVALERLRDTTSAGREIVYFFRGQSALFRALNQNDTPDEQAQLLRNAESDFENALNVSDGSYLRAQVGLGSVYFARAQERQLVGETGQPDLDQSLEAYQQAAQAAPASDDNAYVKMAAQLGLAAARIFKASEYYTQGDDVRADALLAESIAASEQVIVLATAAQEHRVLAQAQQTRGAALLTQGQIQQEPIVRQELLQAADQAFAACEAERDNAPDDLVLQRVSSLCSESRMSVRQLQGES